MQSWDDFTTSLNLPSLCLTHALLPQCQIRAHAVALQLRTFIFHPTTTPPTHLVLSMCCT